MAKTALSIASVRPMTSPQLLLRLTYRDSVVDPDVCKPSVMASDNPQGDNDRKSDSECARKRRFSLSRRSRSSSRDNGDNNSNNNNDELPPEAKQLKQQILDRHPAPLWRFRLHRMRHTVEVPVVPVPPDLAQARARSALVSGVKIPLTRMMFERQKRTFLTRLPYTIDEYVKY